MKCIWLGHMNSIIDVIHFRTILENCHTWAMRVLRPWISGYIDQWKYQHPLREIYTSDSQTNSDNFLQALKVEAGAMVLSPARPATGGSESPATSSDYGVSENPILRGMLKEEERTLLEAVRSLIEKFLQDSASQSVPQPVKARFNQADHQTSRKIIQEQRLNNPWATASTLLPRTLFGSGSGSMPDSLGGVKVPDTEAPRSRAKSSYSNLRQFAKFIPFKQGKFIRVKLPPPSRLFDKDQKPGAAKQPSHTVDSSAFSNMTLSNTDPNDTGLFGTSEYGKFASKKDRMDIPEPNPYVDISRRLQSILYGNNGPKLGQPGANNNFVIERGLSTDRLSTPGRRSSTEGIWPAEKRSSTEIFPKTASQDMSETPAEPDNFARFASNVYDGATYDFTAPTSNTGSAGNTRDRRRSQKARLLFSAPDPSPVAIDGHDEA